MSKESTRTNQQPLLPKQQPLLPKQQPLLPMTHDEFDQFRMLIYRGTHIYCPDTQKALFERKIRQRLMALHLPSFQQYYTFVTESSESEQEFLRLIDVIAIHETSFFRISGHFQGLEKRIFPELFQQSHSTIQVWSSGCSTGEEAYSIAISFFEAMAHHPVASFSPKKLQILATDVSPKVIENAREGRYTPQKVQKIPQAFLDKYFTYHDHHYAIRQQVKDVVTFQVFNVIHLDTPPVSDVHIMFCRNLLIYFDRSAQVKLITGLSHLLPPGGYLFLGDAELLHTYRHIAGKFDILESGDAIIYQKRGAETQ